MNQIKKSIQTYALNEEKVLKKAQPSRHFGFKLATAFALGLVLMFALLPSLRPTPAIAYTAIVRVEINPAFDILVDENDKVVDITPLNEDAQDFDKGPYLDGDVTLAIEAIIAYAIEKGFIDENALESDVVSITTVLDEEKEDEEVKEAVDNLGQRIKTRMMNQEEEFKVNVVFIKATLRELFEAAGKEVPLGLYVIQGKVLQEDGSLIPMKEYLKEDHPEQSLVQLKRSVHAEVRALEATIREMRRNGEDTSELEAELEELKTQLRAYQDELDALENDEIDDEDDMDDGEEEMKAQLESEAREKIKAVRDNIKNKQNNGKGRP